MTHPFDLSIVIISHGHAAMLRACVTSLAPALEGLRAEILVIDNLQDGAAGRAVAGLPVRLLENAVPRGFAANVNAGARATTGRCLLFLNPDTRHRDGKLGDALSFLDAHPEIGLLGCRLLNHDGTTQQSFRRFPSPAVPLARGLGAERWPWRPRWYRESMMEQPAGEAPFRVDWVIGAFLLMRRADFDRLGGMDEGFRLYYEDVDLAWRLRQAGLQSWVFPATRFLHEHQRASAKRPLSRAWRWHVASAARYFTKTLGRGLAALLLIAQAAPAMAEPRCRFPGPFTRVDQPMRSMAGAPLSPLGIVADPTVLRHGSGYSMWFTNADSRMRTGIVRADSTDGLRWTVWRAPRGADRVMDLVLAAPADAWDAPGLETADVLVGPDGIYRMYYTGNHRPEGSVTYAIGLATSRDGVTWTRHPDPVLEPRAAWERPICANPANPDTCRHGGVLEPSVLHDAASGQYRMWYVGLGEPPGSFRSYRIGHATSPDGVNWTRRPAPVFALGARGTWDEMWTSHVNVVADPGGGFHMFYFGSAPRDYRDGVEMQRGAIGHAFSEDGIRWERNPRNPIIAPRPGSRDAWTVGGPAAVIEEGRIRLWFFGGPTSGLASEAQLAEAACGS